MVPRLQGSISHTRDEVVPKQRLQKKKKQRKAIFLWVKTKGKLNLRVDHLYPNPHELLHKLLYFLNVLNGTILYCIYMNIFCFTLYCSLYFALI